MATGEGSCRVLISKVCNSLQGCFVIRKGVIMPHGDYTCEEEQSGQVRVAGTTLASSAYKLSKNLAKYLFLKGTLSAKWTHPFNHQCGWSKDVCPL